MKPYLPLILLAGLAVLIGGFFVLHPSAGQALMPPPAPFKGTQEAASTSTSISLPDAPPSAPAQMQMKFGTPVMVKAFARFDTNSAVSTSAYPKITGTANVPEIGIIVNNSSGKGIVGTDKISVEGGHWSYTIPVELAPGTYTVELYGGPALVTSSLVVTNP